LQKFSDIPVPQYRYFPAHLKETHGPKQWARLRILQACERLDIPAKLWPKFLGFQLPRPYQLILSVKDHPEFPSFRPLIETIAEWKERCRPALEKFIDEQARALNGQFLEDVKKGAYVKIKPVHDIPPIGLRYEWAAKRICLNTPFAKLAKEEGEAGHGWYSGVSIRKTVAKIITEAGLRQGK
jgi:hypothetical protein